MKKIGCSLVRKNVRISEIPFSPRDPNTLLIKLGLSFTIASGELFHDEHKLTGKRLTRADKRGGSDG